MSYNIINPLPKKAVATSETVVKTSGNLYDIEVLVVLICQKYLDNQKEKNNTKKYIFQGKSERSKYWFDLDHE